MNILIFHSVPYPHVEYHRGIDHSRHDVTYFGPAEALGTLPEGLRCRRIARPCMAGACEEARAWMAAHPSAVFDRVVALSEGERLEAARLREWLGLPGDRSDKVAALRNKLWMKQAVAAAGLRVPRFVSLRAFLGCRDRLPWQGKTVLKPHSGAASEDVAVFPSAAAARAAVLGFCSGIPRLDALQAVDACGDFEVEEYVEGPVLHFDGVVAGGTVFALAASRYLNTCLDYARGAPLGSPAHSAGRPHAPLGRARPGRARHARRLFPSGGDRAGERPGFPGDRPSRRCPPRHRHVRAGHRHPPAFGGAAPAARRSG